MIYYSLVRLSVGYYTYHSSYNFLPSPSETLKLEKVAIGKVCVCVWVCASDGQISNQISVSNSKMT